MTEIQKSAGAASHFDETSVGAISQFDAHIQLDNPKDSELTNRSRTRRGAF